jgi:hypothetical protein
MKILLTLLLLTCILLLTDTASGQRSPVAPDFFAAQYAGSIGYFSGGFGYEVFKSRGRASIHFGSVPRSQGGPLNIFAGKLFYETWQLQRSKKVSFNPLSYGRQFQT